jgi:hypothetical protein
VRLQSTLAILLTCLPAFAADPALPYTVVDTGQSQCYNDHGEMNPPSKGQPFSGQDAQFQGNTASYTISGDRLTVLDNRTGLTWQRTPETNGDGKLTHEDKLTWEDLLARPAKLNAAKFGGFPDWRAPTIKELYSLFDARGIDPNPMQDSVSNGLRPFIDTKAFEFIYGDVANGSRIIDSQYGTCSKYVGKSPRGGDKVFGVNFADGRIKGYDQSMPGGNRKFRFFVICVRGNPQYGKNDFHDNGDGTVTDRASSLTWSKKDSLKPMNWEQALAWVEKMNTAKYLGHDDWRMPNIKELQSIVDYTRSPDTSNSPAIDPVLSCTTITNEAGKPDYPYYWSGTSHVGMEKGAAAMYVPFGRAGGFLSERVLAGGPPMRGAATRPGAPPEGTNDGPVKFVDVHGAGAQRSDPKSGDPRQFPRGRGPQGDVIRIFNHVRLVRGGGVEPRVADAAPKQTAVPQEGPPAGPPSGQFTPPLISALDSNHNDIIEPEEIAKASEALKKLDKNGDGKLSPEEYRPKMQGGRMPGR